MKQLKVTVTGWQNTVFVGTEKQVHEFLVNLRESQINAIPVQTHKDGWKDIVLDANYYKKVTQKSKTYHFNVTIDEGREIFKRYYADHTRRKFEEQNTHLGLKIKIEHLINATDFLF